MLSEGDAERVAPNRAVAAWLVGTLFLLPLYPKIGLAAVPGTYIPVRGDDILIAALSVIWVVSLILARRTPTLPRLLVVAAAAWIAASFVALIVGSFVLHSISLSTGLAFWAKPIEYLLLGAVCYDLVRSRVVSARAVLAAIFAAAAIVIGYGLAEHFLLVPRWPGTRAQAGIVTSTLGDMHEFAAYAGIIGLVLVAVWHRASTNLVRLAALGGLIALLTAMFYTGARSEYVALGLCLTALAAWRPSRIPALIGVTTMTLLFVSPFVVDLLPKPAPSQGVGSPPPAVPVSTGGAGNVTDRLFGRAFGDSLDERFGKWQLLLHESSRSPMVGLGPSAATEAADGYYVRSYVESGIVGLLAFLGIMTAVLVSGWRAARYGTGLARAVAVGLFASTVFVALVSILIDTWVASRVMELYWPLVGTTLAMATHSTVVEQETVAVVPGMASRSPTQA